MSSLPCIFQIMLIFVQLTIIFCPSQIYGWELVQVLSLLLSLLIPVLTPENFSFSQLDPVPLFKILLGLLPIVKEMKLWHSNQSFPSGTCPVLPITVPRDMQLVTPTPYNYLPFTILSSSPVIYLLPSSSFLLKAVFSRHYLLYEGFWFPGQTDSFLIWSHITLHLYFLNSSRLDLYFLNSLCFLLRVCFSDCRLPFELLISLVSVI